MAHLIGQHAGLHYLISFYYFYLTFLTSMSLIYVSFQPSQSLSMSLLFDLAVHEDINLPNKKRN